MFHVNYGRNLVYILHVTSTNGYASFYKAQECELKAWHSFVVVRLRLWETESGGICP